MLFTDSLFIFGLILLFFVYFLIPQKYRWMLLLAASIAFYAYSGWTNLFYIAATAVTTFFVTKRMEKMAAAAKDAVAAQTGEIVLVRQRLALVQPFSRGAVDVRIDGVGPAILVDVEGSGHEAGFALLLHGAGLLGEREGFPRIFQPLVVASGLRGDLGIGAKLGFGDEYVGQLLLELRPGRLGPGERFRLEGFLPGIGVAAGHDVDADDGSQGLHFTQHGAVFTG